MSKSEVVFISTPGSIGNLVPLVEFAQLLVNHDPRFHASILTITMPQRPTIDTYIQSRAAASATSINFLHLPTVEPLAEDENQSYLAYLSLLIEKHKPHVKHTIADLMSSAESNRVVAFFVDMFCTSMIDVANELEIPCYMFFASPATFLSFMFHIPVLDAEISDDFGDLDTELTIPGFANSVPPLVLPTALLSKKGDTYPCYLSHTARYKEPKGIVVNTFKELEPHALSSLSTSHVPRVHAIGPVVDHNGPAQWQDPDLYESVVKWLDDQPPSSVVLLCFGSMGSLSGPQVREIAFGLERAGFRFLWALREPPKSSVYLPSDPANVDEVLPDGFLERTCKFGLVCGWVPQVKILAHQAIGGFVSHCGWNSILESLWYGVPIATWPIYSEQQMNAFEMVKELGLAVEIRLDYREGSDLVLAGEVERSIKSLMEGDHVVRARVKDMREKSRMALMENGSAYKALEGLIVELMPKI
ncbi:putative flavonol 3-O-glucosyltransferase [Rosa chinensis]|uniref:Glycosyltransferase n=1 Tax=Rosa chinensis TaxID=74649 RepID=A0A2P6Q7F6_ROSCH|nr:UDP-glycosyltransferase 43 [Rosa chinensis]PRQ30115.1 putative flavonol 3-O-glucosyltransferase [Rosa chinensis]